VVELDLTRPQSRAFRVVGPRQNVVLPWGRGCGKSWFLRNVTWLLVAQHFGKWRADSRKPLRGVRVIALMPTLRQFVAVHGAAIRDELAPDGPWGKLGGKINNTTHEIVFRDGSTFIPVPAAQANSARARGLRGDIVLADECDDIDPSVFDSVARPWFSEPWSLKQRLFGGTPRRGRQGLLYRLHQLGRSDAEGDGRYHSIHATYRDCPELVDPEEVEDARRNSAPSVFRREWECDFDAAEGLVYGDVWDERVHVRAPPEGIAFSKIIFGGDKGYEDPGCLLMGGIFGHGKDAGLWVLDEVYEQHRTIDWWCGELCRLSAPYPGSTLYHDPSAPDWKESYRRSTGVRLGDVDNTIDEGVDAVANLMATRPVEDSDERTARIYIHPRCRNLIREINSYKRKSDRIDPDRYTDEIIDRDNHGPDALRYMVAGYFGLRKGTSPRGYSRHETRQ
jgi:hypothetical protein